MFGKASLCICEGQEERGGAAVDRVTVFGL